VLAGKQNLSKEGIVESRFFDGVDERSHKCWRLRMVGST
jgi:hypothetical protein